MSPILKAILGTTFRHLLTAFLTIIVVKHYVGADIAAKLMKGDTITLWQGYSFSLDTIVGYLIAALPAISIPALIGFYTRAKGILKSRVALAMPAGTTEEKVNAVVSQAPVVAIVTANPDKV